MAEEAPSTVSLKKGPRMRMGSEVHRKYQGGARASTDVKDAGLDLMEKMANVKLSVGDIARNFDSYRIGFIVDASVGAGFGLVGALEIGVTELGAGDMDMKTKHGRRASRKHQRRKSALLGLKNHLIVRPDTPIADIEQSFRHLSRRPDIGVLVISEEIIGRIQNQVNRHEERGALPIVVALPRHSKPDDVLEEPCLRKPMQMGLLNITEKEALFRQIEEEYGGGKYLFDTHAVDHHAHHH